MKKRNRLVALLMVMAMTTTVVPTSVFADDISNEGGRSSEDGKQKDDSKLDMSQYTLKWQDEFNGTELNRDDWNVELHQPGWVNAELQEYVDSKDNIEVKDGQLYIKPVQKKVGSGIKNVLPKGEFTKVSGGSAEATWDINDSKIACSVKNAGEDDWNVQIKKEIPLESGKTYRVSYKATSTADRAIKSFTMSKSYTWYGGTEINLKANETQDVSYEFTMNTSDDKADFGFSFGKLGEGITPASDITVTDLCVAVLDSEGKPIQEETYAYTSGRINTQGKHDFTYGVFETRAKIPAGKGFLPAFWLMSSDENVYGQWPKCGEIDCMEVMGEEPEKVYGTIHYGEPHSESQGTHTLTEGSFADDFHTFTCEWNPGEIKWYVDGKLYHKESDWYSTTNGQGTLTYPAPFDQPFYMILNLAVGGSWVGYPDDDSFEANPYIVDYVRVYQKDSYDENVQKPIKDVTLRNPDANGNYINNGTFAVDEDLSDDADWKFKTALGGDATATISGNSIKIDTKNEGTVDYSVQLVQANVPLEKGATYRVSFDAKADEARSTNVAIKAPDRGYMAYMSQDADLTTEYKTYSYEFKMTADTDANGRLEYNMGAAGSKAAIYLQNVKIEKIKDADPNEKEEKVVRGDGNYIYNGKFQEGEKHLGYWTIDNADAADISVTDWADRRRLKVAMKNNASKAVVLSQTDLPIVEKTDYVFSFDAESDVNNEVSVLIGGNTYKFNITKGDKKTYSVKIPYTTKFTNKEFKFIFGTKGTTYIDNLMLQDDALLKNGSFTAGMSNFTSYVDTGAKAEVGVDSLEEDNALAVNVKDTGDADWKVQVKQEKIPLIKGKKYELTFKAKSDLPRKIRVVMQGQEARDWDVYSNDNIVDLTKEFQTFTDTFVMEKDTDEEAFLSLCFGKIDEQITDQHRIVVDDITLRLVEENTNNNTDSGNTNSGSTGGYRPSKPSGTTPDTNKPADTTPDTDKPADTTTPGTDKPADTTIPGTDKPADTTTPGTDKPADATVTNPDGSTTTTTQDGTTVTTTTDGTTVTTAPDGTTTTATPDGTTVTATPDGTTVTTTPDGTKTTEKTSTTEDGAKTTETVVEKKDGSKVETSFTEKQDGSSVEVKVETSKKGTVVKTTTTANTDGSKVKVVETKKENAYGKEAEVKVTTKTNSEGTVTSITQKTSIPQVAANTDATITVEKDSNGNVLKASATLSAVITGKKATFSGNVVAQIMEAAGSVIVNSAKIADDDDIILSLTAKDEEGNVKYTVKTDTAALSTDEGLYLYRMDADELVMANSKVYKVADDGTVSVSIDKKATYRLVTKAQAKTINNKIRATFAAKKSSMTLKKGKNAYFELKKGALTANVKGITYKSSKASVAKVTTKGKITAKKAGNSTISAKITFKNGSTKTVKTIVNVK